MMTKMIVIVLAVLMAIGPLHVLATEQPELYRSTTPQQEVDLVEEQATPSPMTRFEHSLLAWAQQQSEVAVNVEQSAPSPLTRFEHSLLAWGNLQMLAQDDDAQAKIESAMSAGPTFVAQDATILDWAFDDDGNFVVLREGTNGWSCLPHPEPMCLDEVFMEWINALFAGEDLTITEPGFTYMLQGGMALSNTDPFATEPADDHWVSSAPYMMVIFPTGVDLSTITTDPDAPLFVMYADTPYQHIMVPIGDSEDNE